MPRRLDTRCTHTAGLAGVWRQLLTHARTEGAAGVRGRVLACCHRGILRVLAKKERNAGMMWAWPGQQLQLTRFAFHGVGRDGEGLGRARRGMSHAAVVLRVCPTVAQHLPDGVAIASAHPVPLPVF